MIVTCESCLTRYRVALADLHEAGRLVRCSECGHKWFQKPEDDIEEGSDDDDQPVSLSDLLDTDNLDEEAQIDLVDPIPDSIRPDKEHDLPEEEEQSKEQLLQKVYGVVAACLFFLGLYLGFSLTQGAMLSTWPSSAALYEVTGHTIDVPGEGLVFERLEAVQEGPHLKLSGLVINLRAEDSSLPPLSVMLLDRQDRVLEVRALDFSADVIPGEEVRPFEKNLLEIPAGVVAADISFDFKI